MRVIHPLKMDLVGPWVGNLLHMVQGDSNTRVVELQLFSNKEEWEPPVVEFVTVAFKKPDQTKGFYETDCDIHGNRVQVVLAPQVLTAYGKVTVVVELHDAEGDSLASFPFGIMVSQNPGMVAVASEDYFDYVHPLITEAVKEANLAAAEAYAAAEKANSASEVAYRAERKVDALREVVSKLHNNIVETASGEIITVSDSAEAPLQGLKVFGKTTQNGTPTPDAPVALESVGDGGSVTTTVCGKNLLNNTEDKWTSHGITFTKNADGSVAYSGVSDGVAAYYYGMGAMSYANSVLFKAGSYIFSAENNDFKVLVRIVNEDGSYKDICSALAAGSFTLEEDCHIWATCHLNKKVQGQNYNGVIYPMIRLASIADDTYEPYTATTATVDTPNGLPGIPVTSGGNYTDPVTKQQWLCDEVDFAKGVYVQRVATKNYNGSETWTISSLNAPFAISASDIMDCTDTDIRLLCNRYPAINISDSWAKYDYLISRAAGNSKDLQFRNVNISTLEEWKAHLDENPITVQYILAEENRIPLSEIDPDALAQYAALRTNYPNTTVFNDAEAYMDLKYVADTKLYVDKKFAELAAALVNNT